MEISIKSNKDIEELADEIISLNEITTSTSEVKAKIINLINDTLYHKIKNVTLSTIIKDQFEDAEAPSVEEKEEEQPAEKPAPKAAPKKEPIQETESASSENFTSVTPADIFGAAPKTTKPAVQATEALQPTEAKSQATEAPKPEPAPQTTEAPKPAPQQNISTMEPEAQYEALGEPQATKIIYNGREYELSLKAIKSGALAGKNMLVAIYRVPAEQNAQMMSNPEAHKNFNAQIAQMTTKDMGQTTCFYNAQNAMMYTITSKETMNRYINDLDNAVELFNQALQQAPQLTTQAVQPAPTAPQPTTQMTQPAVQATQPAPVQAPQPTPQTTEAPKTNKGMAMPF